MAQITALLAFVTACSALKTEPTWNAEPMSAYLSPDDFRRLGQTRKATMAADEFKFGGEVAAAEAAAVQAREDEAAAIAAATADSRVSARQMDAESRHAESQVKKVDHEEAMLKQVLDTMGHEADAESRAVDSLEESVRKLSAEAKRVIGQKAKYDRNAEDEALGGRWTYDPALQREEKAEREMQKEFAKEEKEGDKLLVHARKQVDSVIAKEKMYLHHRSAVEHETQMRLAEKADTLRKEAIAKGPLSEDDTLQLLDISKQDLDTMTNVLAGFVNQPPEDMTAIWIEEKLDASRSKLAIASAKMLETIKHKVETFKKSHLDYDNHQFLALLSRTLNETMGEVRSFEDTKDYQMTRLQGWNKANGEKLTLSLAEAIHQGMTGSVEFRGHVAQIDAGRLGSLQMSEACDYLREVVIDAMAPAYQSLAHHREKLDSMSRIMPSLTANFPAFIQDRMGARATALLNMAYMENLALKEAAVSVVQEASPVVMHRLHCTMHSASARSGLGVAVLAAVAAWLAQ